MLISISIDKSDLEKIDAHCKATGANRSKFMVTSSLNNLLNNSQVPVKVSTKVPTKETVKSPKIQSPEEEPKKEVFSKILNRYV